ncbi:MAG: hypothetical protein WAV20_12835 [Blastocatellia bacterium]
MEKSFYVVSFKPDYIDLLRKRTARSDASGDEADENAAQRIIVAITQGGFGQDVVDDELQTKERFLEYLFSSGEVDLPRTVEVFDQYFLLEPAEEFVDLDEEG